MLRRTHHATRLSKGRRVRAASDLIGLVLVTVGSSTAWLAATQPNAASAAGTLPANSVALHNATAGPTADCPGDGVYWHFVLTPNNNGAAFATIVLDVGRATVTYSGFPPLIANGWQTDNVFASVPPGYTVADLQAAGSYATYTGATPSMFVLSGVCDGAGPTTTTTAAATTTSEPTTTTTQQVTTTALEPTTTTTQQVTTTALEPTTTTTQQVTTTALEPTTTAPSSTTSTPRTSVPLPGCIGTPTACAPEPTTTIAPTTTATVEPVLVQPAVAGQTSPGSGSAAQQLASTGVSTGPLAAVAVSLIVLGTVALVFGSVRAGRHGEAGG